MSKTYRGFRTEAGGDTASEAAVVVDDGGDGLSPLPVTDVAARKSPTGFNWGYGSCRWVTTAGGNDFTTSDDTIVYVR